VRPHLRHTSRLTVGSDGTQPGQLVLTSSPTRNRHRIKLLLAANREPSGVACRRAVRQGPRFMLRGRVLCGSTRVTWAADEPLPFGHGETAGVSSAIV
jgi:hypothetical protein